MLFKLSFMYQEWNKHTSVQRIPSFRCKLKKQRMTERFRWIERCDQRSSQRRSSFCFLSSPADKRKRLWFVFYLEQKPSRAVVSFSSVSFGLFYALLFFFLTVGVCCGPIYHNITQRTVSVQIF